LVSGQTLRKITEIGSKKSERGSHTEEKKENTAEIQKKHTRSVGTNHPMIRGPTRIMSIQEWTFLIFQERSLNLSNHPARGHRFSWKTQIYESTSQDVKGKECLITRGRVKSSHMHAEGLVKYRKIKGP